MSDEGHEDPGGRWARVRSLLAPKATVGQALLAVVFVAIGVLVVAAVRGGDDEDFLATARTEDLVRILDDLSVRQQRSEAELRRLEVARSRLQSGSTVEAVQEAQRRADALEVLAGTVPAEGPGISIEIADPARDLDPLVVLDTVQELRDAGAEALQVGDVRVIASTWMGGDRRGLIVDGRQVPAPFRVIAIGDPDTMATALEIPGGVSDTVRAAGGRITVTKSGRIAITAVAGPSAS